MSSTIVKVGRYEVDTFVDLEAFKNDVKLDGSDLNDNFLTQAGMMSYYGALAARAAGSRPAFRRGLRVALQIHVTDPGDKL